MDYLEKSEEITGYKVKIMHKGAFKIRGYTLIIPPAQEENLVGKFWDDTLGDGRVERLIGAAPSPTWLLGLGSWDPECEKHGFRYTICIEDTGQTDFSGLEKEQPLFSKEIGESDWMCFMMTHDRFTERFMKDDPYRMLKLLGYKFNAGNRSLGLHFDAYPPGFDPVTHPDMEFWITVKKK